MFTWQRDLLRKHCKHFFFSNCRLAELAICSLIDCGGFTVTSAAGEEPFRGRQLIRMIDRSWCWNSTS